VILPCSARLSGNNGSTYSLEAVQSEHEVPQTLDVGELLIPYAGDIRDNKDGERDVFNEKPTREEQTVAATEPVKGAGSSGTSAVIHTTKGDIVSVDG
jgi:hypothetical protein